MSTENACHMYTEMIANQINDPPRDNGSAVTTTIPQVILCCCCASIAKKFPYYFLCSFSSLPLWPKQLLWKKKMQVPLKLSPSVPSCWCYSSHLNKTLNGHNNSNHSFFPSHINHVLVIITSCLLTLNLDHVLHWQLHFRENWNHLTAFY